MKKTSHKASLKISQEVIEKIASVAALEVKGVVAVVEPNEANIKGLFNKAIIRKPVEVKINDGIAEISLGVELAFGAKIVDACNEIQRNVKDNVQTMTGIMVSKVNITVEGVRIPENEKPVISEEPEDKE